MASPHVCAGLVATGVGCLAPRHPRPRFQRRTVSSENLGFKTLNVADWKEPDLPFFTNGLQEHEWLGEVLRPQLKATVPKDIQALYEVARAAFAYAWFFMPLTQLGADQCF